MADDRIQFGSVLDRQTSDKKVWLLVIPVVLLVAGGIVWALGAVSRADGLAREADRARAQAADLEKSLEERDKLLVQARKDEALLTTAGQATALFFGASPQATESGIAVAVPDQRAARLVLYGLVAPPEGQEYVAVARLADGGSQPIARVVPSELGTAFLLAKDLPEGTSAIELAFRPAGQDTLDGAEPRVSARYPATPEDRGILMPAQAQARRGRR